MLSLALVLWLLGAGLGSSSGLPVDERALGPGFGYADPSTRTLGILDGLVPAAAAASNVLAGIASLGYLASNPLGLYNRPWYGLGSYAPGFGYNNVGPYNPYVPFPVNRYNGYIPY